MPRSRRRSASHRRKLWSALLFAASVGWATAAAAQAEWRGEAGGTRVDPSATVRRDALYVSGFLQQTFGAFTPLISAAATIAGDSVAAAQLILAATAVPPWSTRAPIDFGALVALYGIAQGDRGISRTAFVRQHVLNERGGYWLGGSLAQTERARAFASHSVELGVWRAVGITRFTAVASTARTSDREVFQNSLGSLSQFSDKVRVADGALIARTGGDRVEVEGMFGMRFGVEGASGRREFGVVSVAVRAWSNAYVTVSSGNQFADPLRGTPEWHFFSLGLRWASDAVDGRLIRSRLGPVADVARLADGKVRIQIAAPLTAKAVEVSGSFTGWEPLALTAGPTGWYALVTAPAGSHQLQVRVDGGRWRVPANLPSVVDEFGQRAGLIIIP